MAIGRVAPASSGRAPPMRFHTVETVSTGASVSSGHHSSLTIACLNLTASVPRPLIPLLATLLSMLCSVRVCHPKLLWTWWMSKDKAIAQTHCNLQYRLHWALSQGNVEITFHLCNKESLRAALMCSLNVVWFSEEMGSLFKADILLVIFSRDLFEGKWGQTFTLSLAKKVCSNCLLFPASFVLVCLGFCDQDCFPSSLFTASFLMRQK